MRKQPFVLRMAGFPFDWLTGLADSGTAAAADRLLAAAATSAGLGTVAAPKAAAAADRLPALAGTATPSAGLGTVAAPKATAAAAAAAAADRLPAAAAGASPIPESAAGGRVDLGASLESAAEEFRRAYDAALTAERLAVRERFVRDEDLRDTLFALNPGSYVPMAYWLDRLSADPEQWRTKDRTKLDALARYLQRVCAKNDTTGHAGPFAVGTFDPDAEGVDWTEVPLRHHTLLSPWAADAILAWYTATHPITASAVPRRAAGVAITDHVVDFLPLDHTQHGDINLVVGKRIQPVDLTAADTEILELCDGARTVAQIGAAVGRDAGPGVTRLADLGLVLPGPELPYGTADPMPVLTRIAADADSPGLRDLVSGCEQALRVQSGGDRAERLRALQDLGQTLKQTISSLPDRGRGGFYQDRAPFFEDSTGRLDPLVFGRSVTARVREALPLITDAFLFLPRLRRRLDHDLLAEWFATRFPAGTASVNDYLRGFADDESDLAAAYGRIERTVEGWHDRLRDAAGATGPAVSADRPASDDWPASDDGLDQLRTFLAEHTQRLPAVCDVDLMLVAAPGATGPAEPGRLVVGEVHSDEELLAHGMFAPFVTAVHPDYGEQVLAAYQGLLGDGEILMNATVRHADKTFARHPLLCPDIESGDRSPLGPELRRQLADLVVCRDPDGLRLAERATGRTVRLITPPLSWLRLAHNPLDVFGFPRRRTGSLFELRAGENLREVASRDLVLSRRAWSVPAGPLQVKDTREAFLAVRRLRDRVGLPRHVFVRTAGEGKPIYVDLDSPLLVRQLTRFAARADQVRFSEMVPGPGQLWLRLGGRSYTSELRFAAFDDRR